MPVALGFLFGLGVCLTLRVIHHRQIAPVKPPRWSRSLFAGVVAALPVLVLGLAALGPSAGAIMVCAALTAIFATRRTFVHRATHVLYRMMIGITVIAVGGDLVILWLAREEWQVGVGTIAGVLLGLLVPTILLMRVFARLVTPLPGFGLPATATQNLNTFSGYQAEALAFCTFLAPQDIPRSLVIRIALETKPGRVPSLNDLAAKAFADSGPDSLNLDPLTQRFAYHRLSVQQRKEWAGRAVRELAGYFPADYADNLAWCERLAPHAVTAARHADELGTERGAAALLLNHVAGYFLLTERPVEAAQALHRALNCASAAFGATSTEVAAIRANLFATPDTFQKLSARFARPKREERMSEHRMLAFGLSIVVVIAAGMVGAALWRQAYESRPKPATHPLTTVADLEELCGDPQRYFPDAAPYSDTVLHPVQLFIRESETDDYVSERLASQVPSPVPNHWRATSASLRLVQLVGCVTRIRTGPVITTCNQPVGPTVLVHQATYDVTLFEAQTGKLTGLATISLTTATCPAFSATGRIYVRPALADYQKAIGRYIG